MVVTMPGPGEHDARTDQHGRPRGRAISPRSVRWPVSSASRPMKEGSLFAAMVRYATPTAIAARPTRRSTTPSADEDRYLPTLAPEPLFSDGPPVPSGHPPPGLSGRRRTIRREAREGAALLGAGSEPHRAKNWLEVALTSPTRDGTRGRGARTRAAVAQVPGVQPLEAEADAHGPDVRRIDLGERDEPPLARPLQLCVVGHHLLRRRSAAVIPNERLLRQAYER